MNYVLKDLKGGVYHQGTGGWWTRQEAKIARDDMIAKGNFVVVCRSKVHPKGESFPVRISSAHVKGGE